MLSEIQETINSVKGDLKLFSGLIYDMFKASDDERKNLAEIPTPPALKKEMLDTIPEGFWTRKQLALEPCCGKGGFLVDLVDRFMTGLVDIEDKEERYRFIVEECIYFSDINPMNVEICKMLLDPHDRGYMLNYNVGDTLALDIKSKWGVEGFDLVVGNPPYNDATGNKGSGHNIWKKFVQKILKDILKPRGLLLFVHPKGWRQIDDKIGQIMMSKQILYLNMNDVKQGLKMFRCSTNYDYYLLENTQTI
jgi:type I restriction-modification system DNA methylase subunit